jgi:DNA processing protein
MSACEPCLRRSWLLARLADPIERARERSRRLPGLLAVPDERLVSALGGADRQALEAEYGSFDAGAARERCHAARIETICRCEPRYPPALRGLPDPPAALFVTGSTERFLALVAENPVAVVGARRASLYGLEVATAMGRGLAGAGLTVVSGMALGVDSAAHTGALEASGATVAVLAGGAERPYPASKRSLHTRIRATGAVVSELPPGAVARRWSFPARNRIIAALAAVTVVVEAGEGSGSLITASLAADLGRDVAAVPGRVTSSLASGTNGLLHDGAAPVRDAQDVLDLLFGFAAPSAPKQRPGPELSRELRDLLEAVGDGSDSAVRLCARGFGLDRVLAGLAELELRGYVSRAAGGRYAAMA